MLKMNTNRSMNTHTLATRWKGSALIGRNIQPRLATDGFHLVAGPFTARSVSTALKPMGLSAAQLADYAYRFALGGIDIIKDDHGLANQPFAPFQEQVEYCLAAVERANRETGRRSIYVPNITAPVNLIRDQALFAKKAGVGG